MGSSAAQVSHQLLIDGSARARPGGASPNILLRIVGYAVALIDISHPTAFGGKLSIVDRGFCGVLMSTVMVLSSSTLHLGGRVLAEAAPLIHPSLELRVEPPLGVDPLE